MGAPGRHTLTLYDPRRFYHINAVDEPLLYGKTARVGKRQGVAAGRTHFDELNGTLLADGDKVQLRQIKISAGILSGNGFVDVASGNQLSGRLNVDLKIRADMGSMPLTVSGTLKQPVWRTGP